MGVGGNPAPVVLFLWLVTATGHAFLSLAVETAVTFALGGLIIELLSLLFPQVCGQRLQRGAGAADRAAGIAAGERLVCKLLTILASGRSETPGRCQPYCSSTALQVRSSVSCLACGRAWIKRLPLLLALDRHGHLLATTTHAPIMAALIVFDG